MPIFQYKCPECNREIEVIETYTKHIEEIKKCPVCNQELRSTIAITNFQIKGYSESNGYHR